MFVDTDTEGLFAFYSKTKSPLRNHKELMNLVSSSPNKLSLATFYYFIVNQRLIISVAELALQHVTERLE